MSQNLYYSLPSTAKPLPDALKYALRKRRNSPCTMYISDIPYLQGLADAGVDGAQQLIELIERHEEVEVFER